MNPLTRLFRRNTPDLENASITTDGDFGWSPAGRFFPQRFLPQDIGYLSPDEIMSVSAVWACVTVTARSLAMCDWNVYAVDGRGNRANQRQSPLWLMLNHRPNPQTPAMSFREWLVAQSMVYGYGYAIIYRDNANRPYELRGIPFDLVTPVWDAERNDLFFEVRVGGQIERIPHTDMFVLPGPLNGESIVTKAARAIALSREATKFALSYFANNAVLGGFIKQTGQIKPDDRERLEATLKAKHKGSGKAHSIMWTPPGIEFVQSEVDAEKSSMVASQKFSIEDIARFFGVPPHKIGALDKATFNNIEHQSIEWVNGTLRPWAKLMHQEADYKLTSPRSPIYTEIDLEALLQGDALSRAEADSKRIASGVITVNEARARAGYNGIGPAGDIHMVQGAMMELTRENLSKPEPQATPPAEPERDDEEGTEEEEERDDSDEVQNLFHAGVILCLENHRRRWIARTKNVAEDKLPSASEELRAKLAKELNAFGDRRLSDEQFAALATQVEAGVEPEKAAAHLAMRATP